MNMPGFSAETSVYRTTNRYRSAVSASFATDGEMPVTPQDCGIIKGIVCGTAIGIGTTVCTASCLAAANAGPLGGYPCWLCWTGFLGAIGLGGCLDCIPQWMLDIIHAFENAGGGGGGGGVSLCCPVGSTCKCGGRCVTMPDGSMACVGGTCLKPLQSCP
jgi:hypothetical protein